MATELITKLATSSKGGLGYNDVLDILHAGQSYASTFKGLISSASKFIGGSYGPGECMEDTSMPLQPAVDDQGNHVFTFDFTQDDPMINGRRRGKGQAQKIKIDIPLEKAPS